MKYRLKTGEEVIIGIKHDNRDQNKVVKTRGGKTTAFLRYGEAVFLGTAVCSEQDVFCRKKGRHIASVRLIEGLKDELDENDRRAILKLLCPEFDVIGRRKKVKA